MDDVVTLEHHGGAAVLTMNRPQVLNALDPHLVSALTDAVEAARESEVGALVLTGSGRAFSSGADLRAVTAMTDDDLWAYLRAIQRLADVVRGFPVPTIAAIHGPAIGGGLELAVNCDVRIASADASFRCPEVEWGLTMTNGSSQLLRDLVGDGWARELLLLGTSLDAQAAARIGLVTRVVAAEDLQQRALAMAAQVCAASRSSVMSTKRLLNRQPGPWPEQLEAELAELSEVVASGEMRRRIEASRR